MGRANLKAMHSSENQAWNTPIVIRDFVHSVPGWSEPDGDGPTRGTFTDPCHNPTSIMDARITFSERQNGLLHGWGQRAYVNSEYGDALPIWVDECASRWRDYETEVIALWPARTDTEWFQRIIARSAAAVLFWSGRLQFLGAKDPAPFPSFLPFWGKDPVPFARLGLKHGSVLIPRGPRAGLYPQKR